MCDEPTQEIRAIAQVLMETDKDTLADALALAGPEVQTKVVTALAWAEFRIGVYRRLPFLVANDH